MRHIPALLTITSGALLLGACTKPAENAAAPAAETNMMAAPEAPPIGNTVDATPMAPGAMVPDAAGDASMSGNLSKRGMATEPHSGSSGK